MEKFLQVVTPQKVGDVYLYDLPANRGADYRYDVPPCGQPIPVFENIHCKYISHRVQLFRILAQHRGYNRSTCYS